MRFLKLFYLFPVVVGICLASSDVLGWSWRDLKIGETTPEDVFRFGGWPQRVVLKTIDYVDFKAGKKCYPDYLEYEDSEWIRSYAKKQVNPFSRNGKVWYDPTKTPLLTTAPLQLSDDIREIRMRVFFAGGQKLLTFSYHFYFYPDKKIDVRKYMDSFNAILGNPITIKDPLIIEYDKGYGVSISTSQNIILFTSALWEFR
jgi:hypothetical protein